MKTSLYVALLLSITFSVSAQEYPTPGQSPPPSQSQENLHEEYQRPEYGQHPSGQIICAGNVPPEGTVITATGNSAECGGSCRARELEPLGPPIMIICGQQPIPESYEIESVTTTPACNCIGEDDNGYVIRRVRPLPRTTPVSPYSPPPNP